MSGQQKLNRISRNKRVIAIPSRVIERTDEKTNVTEKVQLYKIRPLN